MRPITDKDIKSIATAHGLEYAALKAFIAAESSGKGFVNGRLLIQFEPTHFAKYLTRKGIKNTITKEGSKHKIVIQQSYLSEEKAKPGSIGEVVISATVITNGVEVQNPEYRAFELALKVDRESALLSTSFGLSQIMGFNYKLAGFKDVESMYKAFLESEFAHVEGMVNFIKNTPKLYNALKVKNWHLVATYYNGAGYAALAKKLNREPYNITLERFYNKYK